MAPDPLRAVAQSVQTGFLKRNGVSLMRTAEPGPQASASRLTRSGRMSSMWLNCHTEPNSKRLSGLPV